MRGMKGMRGRPSALRVLIVALMDYFEIPRDKAEVLLGFCIDQCATERGKKFAMKNNVAEKCKNMEDYCDVLFDGRVATDALWWITEDYCSEYAEYEKCRISHKRKK